MERVPLPELPVPANPDAPWTTHEAMALAVSYARKAVQAERERCAQLADAMSHDMGELSAAIRGGSR